MAFEVPDLKVSRKVHQTSDQHYDQDGTPDEGKENRNRLAVSAVVPSDGNKDIDYRKINL